MIAASGYDWWVFVHIVGAFGFFMAHGASAAIALKLRKERDLERVRALLDLSAATVGALYGSLLVLLAGGIVAGFVRHWWGQGWIWTAIGVLIALLVAMYALASTFYNGLREAAGIQTYEQKKKGIEPGPPVSPQELEVILGSSRPLLIAAIGFAGLLVILWLMVLKPF